MKQACTLCERTALDYNLFCQETSCPAEMSPAVLDPGDTLGDIEVVRRIVGLRSATVYEAQRQQQRVLLKVAHPGTEHKERLKREALFLRGCQAEKHPPATLPRLLPPYANTTLAQDAYGKTALGGHLLYYTLSEPFDGEPLRDLLLKTPQWWIHHVGWLMIELGATVNTLHRQGLFHFGLSPDCLLVRFDQEPHVPRLLLVDLGIASDKTALAQVWYPQFTLPAYTAPELVNGNTGAAGQRALPPAADYRTDVYGLGLILYEMLVGRPAFPYTLLTDVEAYTVVRRNQRVAMNRLEDVEKVAQIALQATDSDPARRLPHAAAFAEQLTTLFGDVPAKKRSPWPSVSTLLVIGGAVLIIAFLLALALALSQGS